MFVQISALSKYQHTKSAGLLEQRFAKVRLLRILYASVIAFMLVLFLPWTQNIRSNGNVTALQPDKRPQAIQNVIAGKIEKWFVREGQFVHKGDTILEISEIKSEYFNPDLVNNTGRQLEAKNFSVKSYMQKLEAIDAQINAMISSRQFKLEQAENKLFQSKLKFRNDSIEWTAVRMNEKVAKEQLDRMEKLYEEGLKSLTELESRRLKFQENQVKAMSQQNKITTSRNEVLNAEIELQNIQADFREKIAKLESDKNATLSSMYDAEASMTKLQNDYVNYSIRSGFYFITAPQDGFVSKAIQSGVGENIKEGSDIVTIVPSRYELAVEMFVNPMDLPLLDTGQAVRLQFDGWPAIIFSGWPGVSYGTYGGKIVAIDNYISENGKYRILVTHQPGTPDWPIQVRMGGGASCFTLLNDVSVWYELWRNINGFPPDFYKKKNKKSDEKSKK
jgi:adhesin transport system membrane fusion protein